jgi:hypothetical protein
MFDDTPVRGRRCVGAPRQSSQAHFMPHVVQNGTKQKYIILALHSLSRTRSIYIQSPTSINERDIDILNSYFFFIQKMYIVIKSV